MCRLLFSTYSDGPAMVLSPPYLHNADTVFTGNHYNTAPSRTQFPTSNSVSNFVNGSRSEPPKSSASRSGLSMSTSSSTPLAPNPSRKRSRDEFHASHDDDDASAFPSNEGVTPRHQPPEEPIYGEGMVLLNPRTGLALSAESQTGTWFEEKAEIEAAAAAPVAVASGSGRPDLPSRKSQRLDTSAPGWDDITAASIQRKLEASSHNDTYRPMDGSTSVSPTSGPQIPLIDDATRLLGISWQRVNTEDTDMAAALRGWEKYLNNHFSAFIQNSQILLKHRGLNAYLVLASPANTHQMGIFGISTNGSNINANQPSFYLFKDDLTEGQLVGNNWDSCLNNLRSNPIAFEPGSEVMRAAERTPERVVEDKGFLNGSIHTNGNGNRMENEVHEMAMDIDR